MCNNECKICKDGEVLYCQDCLLAAQTAAASDAKKARGRTLNANRVLRDEIDRLKAELKKVYGDLADVAEAVQAVHGRDGSRVSKAARDRAQTVCGA